MLTATINFNSSNIDYKLKVYHTNDINISSLISETNHTSRDEAEFYLVSNYSCNSIASYDDYEVKYIPNSNKVEKIIVKPELKESNSLFIS